VHVVVSRNETLSKLAQWYTGKADNSKKILEHNRGYAKHKLQIGDRVLIPFDLVKNMKPFPKAPAPTRKGPKAGSSKDSTPDTKGDVEGPPSSSSNELSTASPIQPAGATPQPPQGEHGSSATALGSHGKTVEEMVAEEQAELEKARQELKPSDSAPANQ